MVREGFGPILPGMRGRIGGDVAPKARVSGSPAFDAGEWLRAITAFQKLPELLKAVRQLERRIRSTEEPAKN